jgi:hypothetical protein
MVGAYIDDVRALGVDRKTGKGPIAQIAFRLSPILAVRLETIPP